jgi:hypothetical protein
MSATPDDTTIYTCMLQSIILKYGLVLTNEQCAEALGVSTRTLDERRKDGTDCPEYIQIRRLIQYPAQHVVTYQLQKTQNNSIKVA